MNTTNNVNGIKNNVDTSRKLSSLSTTKRPTSMNELIGTIESIPIPTIIEQPIVVSERAEEVMKIFVDLIEEMMNIYHRKSGKKFATVFQCLLTSYFYL
jgi:hypothetical protein